MTDRKDGLPHPTPVEIRTAIGDLFQKDYQHALQMGHEPIPFRAWSLVKEGIRRANEGEYQ